MGIDFTYIITVIVVILFSMTLHEAMHAYTSYWLGDDTARLMGRLTLNPIKHIDPFLTILLPVMLAAVHAPVFGGAKPVPFNPNNVRFGEWGIALVALAGPLTNFSIAFFTFGIWALFGSPVIGIEGLIFSTVIFVNLGFFIFNMIPIPPLDGSRVIYALAPEFVKRGMELLEQFGIMIIFALVLISGSTLGLFITTAESFILKIFGYIFGL